MQTREAIVAEARSWLGVRWRHQGRSREHGVDCVGMIALVGRSLGLVDHDQTCYPRNARQDDLLRPFREHMVQKAVAGRLDGDVLLFRTEGPFVCHAGFRTTKSGREHLVHAYARQRSVIEEPVSPYWLARLTHCFGFAGVEG